MSSFLYLTFISGTYGNIAYKKYGSDDVIKNISIASNSQPRIWTFSPMTGVNLLLNMFYLLSVCSSMLALSVLEQHKAGAMNIFRVEFVCKISES